MKFREFVGEDKVKKVKKKIVQTNIGPTEEEFLKKVLREKPDGSRIKKRLPIRKFLNFSLSKQRLKRSFDYIKSWLIRYNVSFKPINPYLTLYLLENLPKSSNFIEDIKKSKNDIIYKPKGTITIVSANETVFPKTYMNLKGEVGTDYILLDYLPNNYNLFLEGIMLDINIEILYSQCYVKLFEIKSGILTPEIYKDMMFSCPRFPNLKLGNVGFVRSI
jgi:hypothetical protein